MQPVSTFLWGTKVPVLPCFLGSFSGQLPAMCSWETKATCLVADGAVVALLVQLLTVLAAPAEGRHVLCLPVVQRCAARFAPRPPRPHTPARPRLHRQKGQCQEIRLRGQCRVV
jgi:hypothetical protein